LRKRLDETIKKTLGVKTNNAPPVELLEPGSHVLDFVDAIQDLKVVCATLTVEYCTFEMTAPTLG
jgi:hypothetical protein